MTKLFWHVPTTGVGELIRYCPYDGVISDVDCGILRTLIGVRAVGTGNIACLDCVCGVILTFAICCFCGVAKFDAKLWLGDPIAEKSKADEKKKKNIIRKFHIFDSTFNVALEHWHWIY